MVQTVKSIFREFIWIITGAYRSNTHKKDTCTLRMLYVEYRHTDMQRLFSILALSVLPAAAQSATDDQAFAEAVKKFLPPAATAMPAKQPELSFTPDAPRAADSSPEAHPEAYARFLGHLDQQLKDNTYDFCLALKEILEATNDEFAVMSWMEKAAAEGKPAACQFVGDRKLTRVARTEVQSPEVKAAYELVRKAADAGYDAAKINVCMCMKMGIGTEQNEEGADAYIFEACRSGNMIPRYKWLQMSGRLRDWADRERPEVKAEIERGNHHVIYYLSNTAPTATDQIAMLRLAAEKGNPEALYSLSALSSRNAPKDSYTLLQEAVRLHSADALFALGSAMTDGDPENPVLKEAGVQHNDAAGRAFIKLSAMMGNVSASFWLGSVNYHGKCGFSVDKERAFRHFDQGALAGNATCGTAAGLMLLRGLGTTQDTRKGLYYLNVAANAGVPHAVILLAYAQHEGLGLPADSNAAFKLLQEAAAMGQKRAYVYMAYITAKGGSNMTADPRMAERYVRMAALDLKEEAKTLYDKLMAEGWNPEP